MKYLNKDIDNLSVRSQCKLLDINRSNIYYRPRNESDLCNEIYELWCEYSFFGYRRVTSILKGRGHNINHKKVLRLMKLMKIQAIYPKPTTTVINQEYKYPYLLKGLKITNPNQVWSTDITYIRMAKGFVYLAALIDIFSRFIVSWKISISMTTQFCLDVLTKALKINNPKIINTDQGSQFTSSDWIKSLMRNNIQISMDGKGRWVDNIYIERFWRTVKQEEVYINPPDSVKELKKQIGGFIKFYNYQRPHQSLSYKTPSQIYFEDENKKLYI